MSDKNERLDRALDFIKGLPEYPATQLKIIEGEDAINDTMTPSLPVPPGVERLEYALKILDNCAEGYASLVRDQKTYEAFQAIGWGLECRAWSLYGNGFEQVAHAAHAPALKTIRARLRHWVKEALRQWTAANSAGPSKESSAKPRTTREPDHSLLNNPNLQTLNRNSAARALGVSTRTIDRMVEDTRLTPVGRTGRKRFSIKQLKAIATERNTDNRDRK